MKQDERAVLFAIFWIGGVLLAAGLAAVLGGGGWMIGAGATFMVGAIVAYYNITRGLP